METKYFCMFAYAILTIISFQISPSLSQRTKSLVTDQTALLALKFHIISDPSHILATNWTNSSSVCSWHGVTCGTRHQRVSALNLSYMSLSSTIPPQLGHLSFLVSLDLTGNIFNGDLPKEVSLLRRLKFISLRLNNFAGDIPPLFGQLPKLEYLNLRNNSFIGSVPKFLSNLTNLRFLDLTSNSLSGEIPQELGLLQNLQFLQIQINHLSGVIPSAIFNMTKLVLLSLAVNELEGSLPTDICTNLPFLSTFSLSWNHLRGPIPTNLSRCSKLETLSLSYNYFSRKIPAEIGYLTSLQVLYLGSNNFKGKLPQEIGNLRRLTYFAVEQNQIEGLVDFDIFMNMSSLQQVSLWSNKFTGSLSTDVGNLTTLTSFQFNYNYFTGVIPRELGQLYQLEVLTLEQNNFIGSIPQQLFNISTLRRLGLSQNALTGTLPTLLCHESSILERLYLAVNSITGQIPNYISNCSQLKILTFNENRFSGYIPTNLGNLRLLEILHLGTNNITSSSSELSFINSLTNCRFLRSLIINDNPLYGVIPASFGNFSSSLQQFNADRCKLSGGIPVEIGKLRNLVSLSLSENKLSGNIPPTFKNLHELQGFYFTGNMLGGSIPEAICDLHKLNGVYISQNKFTGPILKCLGNVSSLRYIYLDNNMLNSSIPSSLWDLKDLIELDLSSNSLTGVLPQELSNLGVAVYVNLSMNQFSGTIPSTIGKLQNLVEFSLASNRLEGPIPVSVGSMISLVNLDLSYNNLSGSIPKSLERLQDLDYFNVSFNSLSGEIPSDGSFKNFTTDSFKGNEALCGVPRFHVRMCPVVSSRTSKKKKNVGLVLSIVLGVVAFTTVVSVAFMIVRYKRKARTTSRVDELMISIVPERISYYELLQATQQFNESNLIGTGSSCSVYKGILNNGKVIAAKVFNHQSEDISRRFDVECEILRSIRHRNLTSVISSCSNEEFKALVLEYMPKGNLEKWLYSHNYCLSATERLDIMIDVASALEYLHYGYSTPIVHSDLKPSNVLLDEDMVAHVSDFGIAKLLGDGNSFVITNTLATLGYIAPEYGLEGLVSTRCDVYSYGLMLMETFTRKSPCDDMFGGELSLKNWVENSAPDKVIDANLLANLQGEQLDKILQCLSSILELALKCSTESAGDRMNMKETHAELQKIKRRFFPVRSRFEAPVPTN